MSSYLGIDTSNYRTSAALFDSNSKQWHNAGHLLQVPNGQIGLRQSDALFQHVVQLPDCIAQLQAGFGTQIKAVAASTRPRAIEGSYMPCFLAGAGMARSIAHTLDVPFYEVSHQQGHIAAAALSANALHLLHQPFLAWHLSGGTTELLHVKPDGILFTAEIIGGTNDLAAGQLIDRAGKLLNLPFPSGAQLEQLSNACNAPEKPFCPKTADSYFSLSGAQNKIEQLYEKGAPYETVARYTIDIIMGAVSKATAQAVQKMHLPVLCAGGVMSNRLLQQHMKKQFGAYFAEPILSGDNAVGAAVLAAVLNGAL